MSRVTYANTPSTLDQQALRQAHDVRIVTAAEEGMGVNALPPGVYGFTYSPALPNAPLFAERRYRSYETHKLADGEFVGIGFADAERAATLESGQGEHPIKIPPNPEKNPTALGRVPYPR